MSTEGGTKEQRVLARFAVVLLRTPKYALLAANLSRDGRLTGGQRVSAAASIGYALSPIDLLPGLVPVLGQLDDMAVLIAGLRAVVRSCPPEVAEEQLQRSGLSYETMDADLATLRAVAVWIGKGAASLVRRAATASGQFAFRAVAAGVRGVSRRGS